MIYKINHSLFAVDNCSDNLHVKYQNQDKSVNERIFDLNIQFFKNRPNNSIFNTLKRFVTGDKEIIKINIEGQKKPIYIKINDVSKALGIQIQELIEKNKKLNTQQMTNYLLGITQKKIQNTETLNSQKAAAKENIPSAKKTLGYYRQLAEKMVGSETVKELIFKQPDEKAKVKMLATFVKIGQEMETSKGPSKIVKRPSKNEQFYSFRVDSDTNQLIILGPSRTRHKLPLTPEFQALINKSLSDELDRL